VTLLCRGLSGYIVGFFWCGCGVCCCLSAVLFGLVGSLYQTVDQRCRFWLLFNRLGSVFLGFVLFLPEGWWHVIVTCEDLVFGDRPICSVDVAPDGRRVDT